jgi:hypothetical protein
MRNQLHVSCEVHPATGGFQHGLWFARDRVDQLAGRALRAWASRQELLPVSMICPANVKRSKMAAHSGGSVNVFVHDENGPRKLSHNDPL